MKFKFHWLDDEGNTTGFLAQKGEFDGELIRLGETEIPAAAIVHVDTRGNRLVLAAVDNDGEVHHAAFAVTRGSAAQLMEQLGRARSAAWAQAHREELTKQGKGHTYREVKCPHCEAVIDLTDMPETPQVSCDFCHTVGTLPESNGSMGSAVAAEKQFRLCEECGMYSKPRKFTIFYFYFLLVFYGFSSRETHRCPACMRGEAWKMLFGNLLFVLGVPTALIQLFRSYGGTDVGGMFAGLDKANLKARKGDVQGAIAAYQKILEKYPVATGIKYNIGLALLEQQDRANAARMLEYSLQDCANYQPAAQALSACYEQLGETDKLAALKQQWGTTEDEQLQDEELAEAEP